VIGLVAGGAARLIVGGRDEIGVAGIVMLALAGAVIGGLVGNLTVGARDVSTAGLIGSVLGAIASLVAYRAASARRAA
jgi:uncharacterized membrane protein YeaQ/YmgE (transglycosylase-associated protein family)